MPERHAVEAAIATVEKVLAGPVHNARYIVMQVVIALGDASAADEAADTKHVEDLAEQLGEQVRQTWVEWAREQPDPKASWLVPWEALDGSQRDVDMRIGQAVANLYRSILARQRHALIETIDALILHERATRADVLALYQSRIDELSLPW